MDRAYSLYNIHGNIINKEHPEFDKINKMKDEFIELTNKLIKYFTDNNYQNSITWFVNESAYFITDIYSELLNKCIENSGELGLHTHFNSQSFNATDLTMSKNPLDWLQEGLIRPTDKLNTFNKDNHTLIFKAGNHMRNDEMYQSIADLGYKIDCTKVINDKRSEKDVLLFDDSNIQLGSEPFFMKYNNCNILEIPEIRCENIIYHIKKCIENNNLIFIKLQIHHWQYDELIPLFDKYINSLKKQNYDLQFVSLKEMQKIYFEKIKEDTNKIILNKIKTEMINDEYYMSLKNMYDSNFIGVILYLFNNYPSNVNILELFAGIGQYTYLLSKYGFENLSILDFREDRLNKFTNIKSIYADYYKYDIDNFDVIYCTNAINEVLCSQINIQISKYKKFLSKKLNNCLILNINKYGNYEKNIIMEIINELEKYFDVTYLNEEYVVIKNIIIKEKIKDFSDTFKSYKMINSNNVKDNLIIENNQKIIHLQFNDMINPSFGIYFPLFYINKNINGIKKCNLEFECKSTNPINIKVYTGITWIKLETIKINNEFTKIVIEENFNFENKSTYRIGFFNIESLTNVYLKNINLKIN